MPSKATEKTRQRKKSTGNRYSDDERRHALELVVAGMSRPDVAKSLGCSVETIRYWYKDAKSKGTLPKPARGHNRSKEKAVEVEEIASAPTVAPEPMEQSSNVPRDPGQGLGQHEETAILEYKKKYPCSQLN